MNFEELLTPEQRKEILENRILNFTIEAYQLSLNKAVAIANGDIEAAKQTENALVTLSSAIDVYKEELSKVL